MAATVTSAWAKPGGWALESEQHEEELNKQQQENPTQAYAKSSTTTAAAMSDFPDLTTAAATKTKKKKGQTVSLGEFVTGKSNNNNTYQANKGLTVEDMINLPTGPRQRSAEEMERARSNGFRSFDRSDSSSRWGPGQGQGRVNDEDGGRGRPVREPLGPSRADENDDWAATKKPGSGFGRRDGSGGGFFDGTRNSRADEVDSWALNKKEVRRGNGFDRGERKTGFEWSGVADSVETWAKKKDVEVKPRGGGSSFDSLRDRRIGNESSDSDTWGRKREEVNNNNVSLNNSSRPKLNLQPRKLPVGEVEVVKPSKGTNPFGDARPREQVLKEKGEDWKEIDEKLEATKISSGGDRFKRGGGNPRSNEDSTERTWRKNQTEAAAAAAAADVPPPSGENSENEQHTEEPEEEKEDAQK